SLTEAGRLYLGHCLKALEALTAAEQSMQTLSETPKGKLRVALPTNLVEVIMKTVLIPFMLDFPQVELDIIQSDYAVNLIHDSFDIIIQPGPEEIDDSSFIYRKLFSTKWKVVATPLLLQKVLGVEVDKRFKGLSPELAETIPFINISDRYQKLNKSHKQLQPTTCFVSGKKINFKQQFSFNNTFAVLEAIRAGIGMSILPALMCKKELASGEFVECLKDYEIQNTALYMIYPARSGQPANSRKFIARIMQWAELRR
ncbi:MAG: hypothetical protein HRU38_22915, partial [Saccharospirillaceae bacterium]|nr:LysR substrate-binding domain-containing protein [Pseudomonadales bacterium]NRB81476.1 hypothetical protein [Saccharospirillaceae bacterium]